jgi:hypothetical protein
MQASFGLQACLLQVALLLNAAYLFLTRPYFYQADAKMDILNTVLLIVTQVL